MLSSEIVHRILRHKRKEAWRQRLACVHALLSVVVIPALVVPYAPVLVSSGASVTVYIYQDLFGTTLRYNFVGFSLDIHI